MTYVMQNTTFETELWYVIANLMYIIWHRTVKAQSVQLWATGWTIGVVGRNLRIFLFTTASRTVLGPTQPHIHWLPGAPSPEVKRPKREAHHSPPPITDVKEWMEL
jgi:hypothetical protein